MSSMSEQSRLEQVAYEEQEQLARKRLLEKPQKLTLTEILKRQQEAATRKEEPLITVPSTQDMARALALHPSGIVNWNEQQQQAITMGTQGKSFVFIGAAGTGKTTTEKGLIQSLEVNNLIEPLESGSKYLVAGTPGIVLVSYTRRAVRQIARQMPPHLRSHALTIHKLLEFEPVFYEIVNPEGKIVRKMKFEPSRTRFNPLPRNLKRVVIDESSMVPLDLYAMLLEALPPGCQVILVGDLHQLPPVYGESVLAQKLSIWPVIELTEVYRQALDSPIIKIATDIKDGKAIPFDGKKQKFVSPDGKSTVVINAFPKRLSPEDALGTATSGFCGTITSLINANQFNEEEDVILMPHNVNVGTIELNLHIANALSVQRKAVVHHVIAGFQHWYLAIGDRLLVDKQDCVVIDIIKNPKYSGKIPMEAAASLDRWGTYQDTQQHGHLEESNEDMDELLQRMADANVEDKQNQASHVLVLESLDTGQEWRISEVGTYNSMVFAWALTVHKSQGSEWRRVFLFLHWKHHAMCSRELVYTAVTRAREDLIIICEPDRRGEPGTLTKAARSPRIKGNTLKEKLKWLEERAKERLKLGKKSSDEDDC